MSEAARLVVAPIDSRETFKDKAYVALRNVIVSSDIYRSRTDIRLDERQLAQDFGISRTPVREAMAQLEREGFVRSVPRRGVYVVRKTKDGGAADHTKRQRRRHRGPAAHVRDLRGRQAARQAR
jgi:DNA-binding GntR family transcriptional regulator